ncbi:hypothetical protein KP509_26G046800 [Ceratopteris richardii]|uniref:Uncharacterized protein n=2 Tax=Ceratopteris richardii TaxID=49495 RepID=A0A8T2RMR0_CERRI|nr:hypothetical protein KP509_26G046800 [Ceratopteris richardii]
MDHGDRAEGQRLLDMEILDLQESKQSEAMALERANLLLEEKTLLEQKLKLQNDFWELEKKRLQDALAKTMREQKKKDVFQAYEIAALHVSIGSHQQGALLLNLRFEGALDEVEILSSRLKILNVQLQEKDAQCREADKNYLQKEAQLKQSLSLVRHRNELQQQESILSHLDVLKKKNELEIEQLKKEQHKLNLKRKEEVSALLREKNFVWDQLKRMENGYTSSLDEKEQELRCAEEALKKLELRVDELQRAHDDKTVEATILRINIQTAEEELSRLRDELTKLNLKGQAGDFSFHPLKIPELNSMSSVEKQLALPNNGNDDADPCAEGELKWTSGDDAARLLVEKEEELKRTRKLMDELRIENQNLQLLYADLEEQLKEQKLGKVSHNNIKDPTFRSLNADLEAIAMDSQQTSLKASTELIKRKSPASEPFVGEGLSLKLQCQTNLDTDSSKIMEFTLKDVNDEVKASKQKYIHTSQKSADSIADLTTDNKRRSSLFSSAFNIPKVV